MALQSMTGFSRSEGTSGRARWVWELRSVNGKGLDLRPRLPNGLEHLEGAVRKLSSEHFARGNIQISLSLSVLETSVEAVVNEAALSAILSLQKRLAGTIDASPIRLDTLLTLRGIVDLKEFEIDPAETASRDQDIEAGFGAAAAALRLMRETEGQALSVVLNGQLDHIETHTLRIEADPSRSPQEISRKLLTQINSLMEAAPTLDQDRLHAEAALLATKADLREEIDRLKAHIAAGRDLLNNGGPVGRKLDFLAQEFNREANTICSKSNSTAVTASGIELKVVIDQFREQVQNLE